MKKRIPWNKGKRKPIVDELGYKWCNCEIPNLVSNHGFGRGLAYCLKCKDYYYH